MNSLKSFFEQYIPNIDASHLINAFSVSKKLKKKEFLVQPNQDSSFLAFIQKGVFRVFFYTDSGIEVTVWFSFEGMMVTDMLAFFEETKASFYVQAVEESEILIIQKSQLEQLYKTYPEYIKFGKEYAEMVTVNVMKRILTLQNKTAEDQYLELLKTPKFFQKIPLKYLASYLGVTDTSLSRIRKKLSQS